MTTSNLSTDFSSDKGQHMENNTLNPIQSTQHKIFHLIKK